MLRQLFSNKRLLQKNFLKRSMSSQRKLLIGLVSPKENIALKSMPQDRENLQFIVGNDLETFLSSPKGKVEEINALMIAPPGNAKVLEALWPHVSKNVKWIHGFFAGVDSLSNFIQKDLLQHDDVVLTNGRGAFSLALAEYIIGAMLHFNKQVPRCLKNRENKKWDKFMMDTLKGKTVGFVGFGDIAQAAAKIAKDGFGMKILALRRNPEKRDNDLCDEVFGMDNKEEIFTKSDFIVCTLPGTPTTIKFIGAKELQLMPKHAALVSCGRGVCIDEDALAETLQSGGIVGAALDVFAVEPLPQESKIWDCPNILLTAHNADYTEDYHQLGWEIWQRNYEAFIEGKPLVTVVDKKLGY